LPSCTNHKKSEPKGIKAKTAGAAFNTAHWPKQTAMATMPKLYTAMLKKERSPCGPFNAKLMHNGRSADKLANSHATDAGS
jgi:hypothetical protein